jgi:shikimate kinase
MKDIIFIWGSPGTGKTTICRLLKEKLNSPYIDYDWIRDFHLDSKWKNKSEKEGRMSFENYKFIIKNYLKNKYKNIILTSLSGKHIHNIIKTFQKKDCIIFSLIVEDDKELKKRVLTESRDSGYRNYKEAIKWNKLGKERKLWPNEIRIDNTHNSPNKTVKEILKHLE